MSNITKLDSGAAEQFAMFVKTKKLDESGDNMLVYFTSVRPVVKKALIRANEEIKDNIHGLSTGSLLAKLNHFDSKEEKKEQARVDREEEELFRGWLIFLKHDVFYENKESFVFFSHVFSTSRFIRRRPWQQAVRRSNRARTQSRTIRKPRKASTTCRI